jgi:hypothetical protein
MGKKNLTPMDTWQAWNGWDLTSGEVTIMVGWAVFWVSAAVLCRAG